MNETTVEKLIREFIAGNLLYSAEEFTLPADASLLKEGIIDSLGVVELVEFVQSRFGIRLGQQEVIPDNFESVGRLVGFVIRKLAGEGAVQTAVPDGKPFAGQALENPPEAKRM